MLEYVDATQPYLRTRLFIGMNTTNADASNDAVVSCLRPLPNYVANGNDFIPYLAKQNNQLWVFSVMQGLVEETKQLQD